MRQISLLELDDCRAIVIAAQAEADRRAAVVSLAGALQTSQRCRSGSRAEQAAASNHGRRHDEQRDSS